MIDEVKEIFRKLYGKDPILYAAPGRINLIGEHTDYNDGFVLPAAIDKQVIFGIGENGRRHSRFHAVDMSESCEVDLYDLHFSDKSWPNYLTGVIDQLQKRGHEIRGFDCVVTSNIPIGAGLSSSAALESGLAIALNEIFGLGEQRLDLVKLAQKAENEFVGVNCGIMDQFASVFGKDGHVFRLDCRTLDYEYFPLKLNGNAILLIDTNVKHSLASSEYNTRRKECEEGVRILSGTNKAVRSLRDVSVEMLETARHQFSPLVYKRCDYVVHEIARVVNACDDLVAGRIEDFGQKMYDTHEGLKTDYEVSCPELDFLVDITKNNNEVLGARMMGGGFGGCTINILKEEAIDSLKKEVSASYDKEFGHVPTFYDVRIADGIHKIGH